MSLKDEIKFEKELCEHLAASGWEYSETDDGYDKQLALYPADIWGWLEDTQADEFAKIVDPASAEDRQQNDFDRLVGNLAKKLDTKAAAGGGTLNVLRKDFDYGNASFAMSQSRPQMDANAATIDRYKKVRLRVMRQVHYSLSNAHKSLDLVFFVNGIPVATSEVKTDFTQSVGHATDQYKTDRLPVDPKTKKKEPLLGFGNRALVHFAVSNSEVHMTTHLLGESTHFLPFNMGNDGRAGNPVNPVGSKTSYLWERVLQRDSWMTILHSFMHLLEEKKRNPLTKQVETKRTILFPRFHQLEAVNKMVETAAVEGPGHKYLIQHSAGSGKTNSIAWTAHRLATLHNAHGDQVFDTVIVVSDRKVLDQQLRAAILQIENTQGLVEAVDEKHGSKSGQLAKFLQDNTPIISVTIQTFPFALEEIRKNKALKGKKFAIIADEAHSSQSGAAANKLKEVLTPEEFNELQDGGEVGVEELLLAEMTNRAESKNISYFAFTATPKAKTLDLFGRKGPDGTPVPFHLYTMQQAIEEEFILDVLKNYTPYDLAYKLAKKNDEEVSGHVSSESGEDRLVDKSEATKEIVRWVRLHPHNIAQKVQIIVEHFRQNIGWRLEGKAKAMVVTGSRKEAVRYKLAMDKYIASKGYKGLAALVAFSGEVTDDESLADFPMAVAKGQETFSESNMNFGVTGDLAESFDSDAYQVMLVANKYQTGFDQPLLMAMYVDKRLGGVSSVQTLSRLNRKMRGKDKTFVLDFVNDPQEILKDFKPYFRAAELTESADPNIVHSLRSKLDAAGLYNSEDVERTALVWLTGKHGELSGSIAPVKDRFNTLFEAAVDIEDTEEVDRLETFRKDLTSFVHAYDFLSQIINYGQTALEKRSIYYRLLASELSDANRHRKTIDLSEIVLTHYALRAGAESELSLDGGVALEPLKETGTGSARQKEYELLSQVLGKINEVFAGSGLGDADKLNVVNSVKIKAGEDETLQLQADANGAEDFYDSPDLVPTLLKVIMMAGQQHESGIEWLLNSVSPEQMTGLAKDIDLWGHIKDRMVTEEAPRPSLVSDRSK